MSETSEKAPKDDICVRKLAINQLFDKPLPDSTFHDRVNRGEIRPSRIRGYYLLNATRINLGLPEIDIQEYRRSQSHKANTTRMLVFTALATLLPEHVVTQGLPFEPLADSMTSLEIQRVQDMVATFSEKIKACGDDEAQMIYTVNGALMAVEMMEG